MTELTLEAAQKIVSTALEKGREMGLNPLTVAVLDAGGALKAFARDDGAAPGRYEIARAKAYGAVMLGMGGRAQMARAEAQAYFIAAANGALGGGLVPVPGGVLVRSAGRVIGAVGVSGDASEKDEAAALAGIAAAGLDAEP